MLQNREVNIDEFIKINSSGVTIADYDQVQAALVTRYKETYGQDIDLTNTTADGVFVNNLALIINNILQSFKILYDNLNVDTASGVYLDSLCRLSNVTRKRATKSTAQLLLTTTQNATPIEPGMIFIDTVGNEWELTEDGLPEYSGTPILLNVGDPAYHVTATCTEYGPIEASANTITQTLEASAIVVSQPSDAAPGSNTETDAELRARRDQSNGSQGITVIESLVGALLAIEGIDDVRIENNNTNQSAEAADGAEIKAHSVYITIRKRDNVDIDDSTIGDTIFNTLTPGISTNEFKEWTVNPPSDYNFVSSSGVSKSSQYPLDSYIQYLNNIVYWKEAVSIAPTVTLTIKKGRNYSNKTSYNIAQDIVDYLNSIKIAETPTENDMIITATYADSNAVYIVEGANVSAAQVNPDTYFHYINDLNEATPTHVIITEDSLDPSILTFTFQ